MNQPTMPPLETERLLVRPFVNSDIDDVYRIIDCDCFGNRQPDDEHAKQQRLSWLEWNVAGLKQQASLGHPPYGDRAIVRKSDMRIVGVCGLVPSFGPFRRLIDGFDDCSNNSPEMGLFYAIAGEHRRNGYATEAARALIRFAFETLRADRIVATTEAENEASIGVMQRLGFVMRRNSRREWPQIVGFVTSVKWKSIINTKPAILPSVSSRSATGLDIQLLAQMNQRLIEDEGSRNPMSLAELEERMASWIAEDWQAHIFERDGEPVGYILFQFRSDEYRHSERSVYVRQFFIERAHRSQGIGGQVFDDVAQARFANASSIVLDVLECNPRAKRFWEAIGFRPYCSTMIRERRTSAKSNGIGD